jgi:flagellar protein FlaI
VLKRFTTDPINVSKTMFTALDLVSIQTSTRVQGKKVRRNKSITEINHYDAENDEINVQDVFQWQAETDEFLQMGDSNTLEDIMFDRGWSRAMLDEELRKRRVVLAYLIDRGLNSYAQVAATFQAFINDPETVLALMANEELERSLEDLREMESVLINVDREKEKLVPRPKPDAAGEREAAEILDSAEDLFETYRGEVPDSVADALLEMDHARDVEARPTGDREALAETAAEANAADSVGDASSSDGGDSAATDPSPADGDPSADSPTDPSHGDFEGVSEAGAAPAGDGSGAPGDVDFDEPFDGGVDVLSTPSARSEGDASADAGGRFGAVDGGMTGSSEEGTDDAEAGSGDDGEGNLADAGRTVTEGDTEEGAAAEDGADADSADDIDDWGFDAVEPAEEG